jgi:hypothetical protein
LSLDEGLGFQLMDATFGTTNFISRMNENPDLEDYENLLPPEDPVDDVAAKGGDGAKK